MSRAVQGPMERPVIFSAPMVRAILEDRKSQTRRIVKGMALKWLEESGFKPSYVALSDNHLCPYGVAGDRLWVRETWQVNKVYDPLGARLIYQAMGGDVQGCVHYCADKDVDWAGRKRPSIHMPRWASRITLDVTKVRVERLQDISEEDAKAEGSQIPIDSFTPALQATLSERAAFAQIWNRIHGEGAWDANPWVWVLSFERNLSEHETRSDDASP